MGKYLLAKKGTKSLNLTPPTADPCYNTTNSTLSSFYCVTNITKLFHNLKRLITWFYAWAIFYYAYLLIYKCLTFNLDMFSHFTSKTTTFLIHLASLKLVEDGITAFTLSATAQGNFLSSLTFLAFSLIIFPVFSLLIFIFVFLTFTLNHLVCNAPFQAFSLFWDAISIN